MLEYVRGNIAELTPAMQARNHAATGGLPKGAEAPASAAAPAQR